MAIQKRIVRRTNNGITRTTMVDVQSMPRYGDMENKKIALIQPGSWGDNINSTLMFKPLKAKWPNCIIDVYTSSLYGNAFHNNPFINVLHETPANTKQEALHQLVTIPPLLEGRGYDLIFRPHPMVNPDKWTSIKTGNLGTNLICAWVRALEDADIPYTLPLETILSLTTQEIDRVRRFCSSIDMNRKNIIMEVHGESGQTFWTPHWTDRVCRYLLRDKGINLFISRKNSAEDVQGLARDAPGQVHFVGGLTIRECAELFNKCQVFFSISSGLSNACNTNWCKKDITWIETVNGDGNGGSVTHSAPIRSEGKLFWYDNNLDAFINMLREKGL